jgi:hypothetical protein
MDFGLGQFAGKSDGDGSRSGADVDEFEARAEGEVADEIEDYFDEVLGLRAWNEHRGGDEKVGAPELLMSGEVLQRLSGSAAGDEPIVLRLFVGGEFALGVGVQSGTVAAEDVKNQDLGTDAGLIDGFGCELSDGGEEGLAELHEFIVKADGWASIFLCSGY